VVIVDGGDKLDVEDEFDGSDAHAHARLLTSTTVAASFFHPAAILVSRAEGFEGLALVFKLAFDIMGSRVRVPPRSPNKIKYLPLVPKISQKRCVCAVSTNRLPRGERGLSTDGRVLSLGGNRPHGRVVG
jgi:hypothetical protein